MSKGGGSKIEQGPRGEGRDQDRSWDQFAAATKPNNLVFYTGPSSFSGFKTEEGLEDYCARDSSNTSFVSSRTHTQPEKEDPADQGVEAEGGSS
jgi:hypothetical protein